MNRSSEHHYLALDLGAESGRAIVGTLAGDRMSLTEVHRFANTPLRKTTGLHWNVSALWDEICRGISFSASKFHLESLALDTWGADYALLGKDGTLLNAPYHYRDVRTDGMLEEAFRRLSREEIFAQTGSQFLQVNTLYQLLSMAIAKDAQLENAQTFLMMPDLFNRWLSGQTCCEFTSATTGQIFNPLTRNWAMPIFEALSIPTRIFPPICEPGTCLGKLLPMLAKNTGAGSIPVIAPACHDTGSAVASVPSGNPDFAWLSSGTWSIIGTEVRQPVVNEKVLAYNFTNEGGVSGAWELSKNILGLWLVQECKREWGLSYDEITRLASDAKPFRAVIDPDNDLFLHPGQMPEKIRKFCAESGQAVPETQGEIIRVILESLALKYRFVLERLDDLVGKRLEPLHIIGGGTKNRLLNQFSADATGRTVIAGPVEATAIGNILMQALTLGEISSIRDARLLVRRSFAIDEYHPGDGEGWEAAYERLQSLLTS